MKTMCPPGYHHNGLVATHAFGHMMYIYIYRYIYIYPACYIYHIYIIDISYIYHIYIYIYMIYLFISRSKSVLKATIVKETKKSSRSYFSVSIKYLMVASNMFVLFVLSKYSWWYKKISAMCFRPERFGLICLTDSIRLSFLVKKLGIWEENQ